MSCSLDKQKSTLSYKPDEDYEIILYKTDSDFFIVREGKSPVTNQRNTVLSY